MAQLVLEHLLTISGFLLAVVLAVRVLQERRQPGGTLAWLMAIILIPYVGVPLYLLIGGRKVRRAARKKGSLYTGDAPAPSGGEGESGAGGVWGPGVPPPRSGNTVDMHFNGETAFWRLMGMIEEAEKSLHVMTFILGREETGKALTRALARKAAEGVEVRLLLDSLGSIWASGAFLRPVIEAGGRVATFMPVLPVQRRWSANLRNHRKIVVADHRVAMVGGMNLASAFMGPTPDPRRFVDMASFLEGPAVADIERVFLSDWHYATNEELELPGAADAADGTGPSRIQVVASGPDVPEDTFNDALLSAVMDARRRIWLVTPYFIPDEAFLKALEVKARGGKDVRVLVPLRSNHRLADIARGPSLRALVRAGGKVYGYPRRMVHAKAMIFDHTLAITGTPNLDMRSLYLNYEIALFHHTRGEVDRVAAFFSSLEKESAPLGEKPVSPSRAWAEQLCHLISPLL